MDKKHPVYKGYVSHAVADMVEIPDNPIHDIELVDDVLTSAIGFLHENKQTDNFRLLFFIPLTQAYQLDDFFRDFSPKKLKYRICALGDPEIPHPESMDIDTFIDFRASRMTENEVQFILNKAVSLFQKEEESEQKDNQNMTALLDTYNDQESLINIGRLLSIEKDSDKLLRTILYLSKKITGADAGSIFLIQDYGEGTQRLRFKYSHTFSKNLAYEEFTLPLDSSSIAGYVAVTGITLNIPNVYELTEEDPVHFNPSFDMAHGYVTKSMLIVPMRNHEGAILGVIQLINSKECMDSSSAYSGNEAFEIYLETPEDFQNHVVPFDKRYEALMEAVASQAAIAIENNRMLKQIEEQFEAFVTASVGAIESRDPATSGHSTRVAQVSVNIAKAINACKKGSFKKIRFSESQLKELRYAGLLHDFGKVYIDPAIFLKAKKLYAHEFNYLILRLEYLLKACELEAAKRELESIDSEAARNESEKIRQEFYYRKELIEKIIEDVTKLNEPRVTVEDPQRLIDSILKNAELLKYSDPKGTEIPLLTEKEVKSLKIPRGSLTPEEREIIESHVVHTYSFVSKIPWPDEYREIPEIAGKHHEMLDGSGYPNKLKGIEQIPLQARIMAVADVYDALSATDRPYKKAIPFQRVVSILKEEAERGRLDKDVVDLFINCRIYEMPEKIDE
ncbi:MAG: HD domain-containing phosphohydrolase [Spirochaetia bacterium]